MQLVHHVYSKAVARRLRNSFFCSVGDGVIFCKDAKDVLLILRRMCTYTLKNLVERIGSRVC